MSLRLALVISGDAKGAKAAADQTISEVKRVTSETARAAKTAADAQKRGQQDVADATRLTAQQLGQMQFQLQDMAIGLSSGQSPFTVITQQGSQIVQMFKPGTGVMAALRGFGQGVISFITNPLNLATVGFGLALTAATSLFSYLISQSGGNDVLERHADLVKRIGEEWDGTAGKFKKYSTETRESFLLDSLMAQGDLQKAVDEALSQLQARVVAPGSGGKAFTDAVAGVPLTEIMSVGGERLVKQVEEFRRSVLQGDADVQKFRNAMYAFGVASDDEKIRTLTNRLGDNAVQADKAQQAFKQNRDIMQGLRGNAEQLSQALGETSKQSIGLARNVLTMGEQFAAAQRGFGGVAGGVPAREMSLIDAFKGKGSILGLGVAPQEFKTWIFDAAEQNRLDPDLLARVLNKESGFNPNAVSARGAMGLAQLMPGTAKDLGIGNPFNPRESIYGGAKYLGQLMKQFSGNEELSLMGYNWGAGNVRKWQQRGADFAQVPGETRDYVAKITGGAGSLAGFDRKTDKAADSEAEKRTNQEKSFAAALARSAAEEVRRTKAIGETVRVQAELRTEQQLWSQAQSTFGDRIEKEIDLREKLTAAIGKESKAAGERAAQEELARRNREAAAKAEEDHIKRLDSIRDVGRDITSTLFQSIEAGQSWGSAFSAVLDNVKKKGLDLLDDVINNLLFGQQGSNSGGLLGGFTEGLSGLFSGLFNPAPTGGGLYATGGGFGHGVQMFAEGGSFTNSIVSKPTLFGFGGKLGLMGEKTPEAIMPLLAGNQVRAMTPEGERGLPLTRMRDGHLGVMLNDNRPKAFARGDVFGGSAVSSGRGTSGDPQVNVHVHQYGQDKVESAKATKDQNGGINLEIAVGQMVNRHIASGNADTAMQARFAGLGRRAERNG